MADTTTLHQRIKLFFFVLLGISVLAGNFFLLKIPPTLRRIHLVESYTLKILLLAAGLAIILLTGYYYLSHKDFAKARVRKIIMNTFILLISLLISLLFLELFLQLTSTPGCRQNDPLLDHSYKPHCSSEFKTQEWKVQVDMNGQGLRDDELESRDKYQHRILLLGDSFLMGYGIEKEKRFSEILEQKLQATGQQVDVINAGVTSYSPVLEYLYLKERGLGLEPDIVLLLFDMSDVQNDYMYSQRAVYDQEGKIIAVPYQEPATLLLKIYYNLKIIPLLESILSFLDSKIPSTGKLGSSHFFDLEYDKYAITREGLSPQKEQQYWNVSLTYLQKIKQLCEQHNITFILATYPYGHQVSPQEWGTGRHNYGFQPGIVYSDKPNSILGEFARRQEIFFISLFLEFNESKTHPLFFSYDGHFNNAGHALAAEVLYQKLMQLNIFNLVPERTFPPLPKTESAMEVKNSSSPSAITKNIYQQFNERDTK